MKSANINHENEQATVVCPAQEYEERMQRIEKLNEQTAENIRVFFEGLRLRMEQHNKEIEETDRRMKETDRRMKETDRLIKETDLQIKETAQRIKETGLQMKETDRKIKELSTRFGSTTGHIIEGLMAPAAFKMLHDAGFNVNRCYKNLKRKSKDPEMAMEIDELLLDDTLAIAVEVKASCDRKDIDDFLKRMERFKTLYPENRDKDVYVAIAAINFERNADVYAHEQGLLVIRVTDYELFSLDSFAEDTLRKY